MRKLLGTIRDDLEDLLKRDKTIANRINSFAEKQDILIEKIRNLYKQKDSAMFMKDAAVSNVMKVNEMMTYARLLSETQFDLVQGICDYCNLLTEIESKVQHALIMKELMIDFEEPKKLIKKLMKENKGSKNKSLS